VGFNGAVSKRLSAGVLAGALALAAALPTWAVIGRPEPACRVTAETDLMAQHNTVTVENRELCSRWVIDRFRDDNYFGPR
jgi:hypothetical protein